MNFRENFRAKRDGPRKVIKCFTRHNEEAKSSSELDVRFEKWHTGLVRLEAKESISSQAQYAGAFRVNLLPEGKKCKVSDTSVLTKPRAWEQ